MPVEDSLTNFIHWYNSLKKVGANRGPAIGTIAAGLVVLDRLKDEYDLDIRSHLAPSGTQIAGVSGASVANILKRFGEERPFAKEGGRTNRGLLADITPMLKELEALQLEALVEEERNEILSVFQKYLDGKSKGLS